MNIKNIIYILCIALAVWSCGSAENKAKTVEESAHEHGESCDHDHDHDHKDDHEHPEGGHEGHDHDHSDDHTGHNHGTTESVLEDEIVFTKAQAEAVGLELEEVKASDFYQVIKTSGQIISAQGDEATISATISGIVSFNKSSLNEGAAVAVGESLLSISSKNMVDGDPIQIARNQYQAAKREFDRAESLIVDKLISETEYNTIKLNYDNAKASYSVFSKNQTTKGSSMSSKISGFVKTKLVKEGDYVEVGQPLLTVTQNKKLQLRADVSQRYYNSLGTITSANFKTPYDEMTYKLSELNGRMTSYGRSVGTDDYYLPINFEFDNIGQVVPGSFADVYLLSGRRSNVISVPIEALIEDQGVHFVFVQLDAEGYKMEEVRIGASDGARVEILSGIKEGQKIVSKAAIHLKLASSSSAIPHAHEH